jgi:hypothetical protein
VWCGVAAMLAAASKCCGVLNIKTLGLNKKKSAVRGSNSMQFFQNLKFVVKQLQQQHN